MIDGVMSGRAGALDLARGWALLGVGIVNVHVFANGFLAGNHAWDKATSSLDRIAELMLGAVFEHRAFPTLAFLFGVGLTSFAARRGSVVRLWLLLALGVVLGLTLWPGEILSSYALIAILAAYRIARGDEARAARWVGALLALNVLIVVAFALVYLFQGIGAKCAQNLSFASSYSITTWLGGFAARMSEWFSYGLSGHFLLPTVWLCVFLGVLVAKKADFWNYINASKVQPRWVSVCIFLFVIATGLECFAGVSGGWDVVPCSKEWFSLFILSSEVSSITSIPVILATSAFLYHRFPSNLAIRLFVVVGRAPLSMFVGQCVVFMFLFHHAFGDLNARVSRYQTILIALVTFLALAVFLERWQNTDRFSGPLDAFMRRLERVFST
jgi:uncharacterized protein